MHESSTRVSAGNFLMALSAGNENDADKGRSERVTDRLRNIADRLDTDGGRLRLEASTPQDIFRLTVDNASAEGTHSEATTVDGEVRETC